MWRHMGIFAGDRQPGPARSAVITDGGDLADVSC
jgi:hypothetical protein